MKSYRDRVDCCFSLGRVLLLTVTAACNQRCVHCLRDATPARAEPLNLDRLAVALAQAFVDVKPERVVISGGEPTLVENLPELVAVIVGLGARPSLCTNATRIDRDMARLLHGAGLVSATVGIDGIGMDYARFRRSGSGYVRALGGIQALLHSGIAVTVNVAVHDRILHKANEIGQSLIGLGLDSVSVTSPIAQGRLPFHISEFRQVTPHAVECFATQLAGAMDCPVSLRMPRCDRRSCPSGRTVFAMDRDGRVSECPDVGSVNVTDLREAPMGRIPLPVL